ncbi:ECF transporter S component [Lacticaseibacillus hulanensis]|uniref:ECF transporter S component n=1 Tax=Lacticaseibacillus hulanensis TaxID=2493111 RepID=UPI000FD6BAF7|nr:ECF transporter S component [Lacticaseibacillus hulanensis]
MGHSSKLRKIIFTALFAAIIYIGISVLRIPIPAMVGRPFVHFGNPLMDLAIIFLGGGYGFVAAAIGLGGFDVLNGYAATSWLTVLEVAVMAIVLTSVLRMFRGDDRPRNIIILGIIAGVTKICTTIMVGTVEAMLVGNHFIPAVVAAVLSLPATIINSVATAIIVPILYFALRPMFHRFSE